MKILVTGGAGFMGSHFLRYMVNKYPQHQFINFDKLTYAGNLKNVKDLEGKKNYKFIKGDICDLNLLKHIMKEVEVIFNFAAESHVDNSIFGSLEFTKTNTLGTHMLLEVARNCDIKKFIHISTDEVYGDILKGSFKEEYLLSPTNPYSASKAAAEMLVNAYYKTYKIPTIIIRGCNNYGPNQYPEKIISRFIIWLLKNEKVPLHGTGKNIRNFIHVEDFCTALDTIFQKGVIGEKYNIGTDYEISNLKLTKMILNKMGKNESFIKFIPDRPFNDKRYSVDSSKILSLGWFPKISFEAGLNQTIEWYKKNKEWWEPIYEKMKK